MILEISVLHGNEKIRMYKVPISSPKSSIDITLKFIIHSHIVMTVLDLKYRYFEGHLRSINGHQSQINSNLFFVKIPRKKSNRQHFCFLRKIFEK